MKYTFPFAVLLFTTVFVKAQSPEDSVKAAINKLFTAMKNVDPLLLKSSFADSAILQSVAVNKDGKVVIENEKVNDFVNVISKLSKNDADERIQFDVIKIDGALAIAWTPINFIIKENSVIAGLILTSW